MSILSHVTLIHLLMFDFIFIMLERLTASSENSLSKLGLAVEVVSFFVFFFRKQIKFT